MLFKLSVKRLTADVHGRKISSSNNVYFIAFPGSPEQLSSRHDGGDVGLHNFSRPDSITNQEDMNNKSYLGYPPPSDNCRRSSAGSAGPPVRPRYQKPNVTKRQCQRSHPRPSGSVDSLNENNPPQLPVHYAPHSQHAPVHVHNSCHGNTQRKTGYYGNPKACDDNHCCCEDSASSEDEGNIRYSQSDIDQALQSHRGSSRYSRPRKVQVLDTISDNGSTTSGSYVVDPQDLCNEISELFFKDMVV